MNCEQIAELLPDYLQGSLMREQVSQVEQHCEHCATCAQDVAMWKKLALLPPDQPSPDSRARFDAMLHAYSPASSERSLEVSSTSSRQAFHPKIATRNVSDSSERATPWSFFAWLRSPLGAVAWSAALLIFGVFIGTRVNKEATPAHPDEIAAMHAELTNMRQLVALSMLQQQSASERLQGVSWSGLEAHLDPQIQSALLRTLRYDGSVDVRLAALDALSRHASQPQVRKGIGDALQEQQSPLVQVALIDQLAEWRDPDATQRLRNFQQTPNLNPAVRQRAEWAISKLQ
jgi:anti-sigma factor RsiW